MWFRRGAFSLRTYTTTLTLVCLRLRRSFYSQSIANMLFACAQNAHLLVYLPFTLSALILHLLRLRKMVVTAWHVYVRTRVRDVRLRITRFVQHFQPQPRVGGTAFHFSVTFVMVKIIRFIQCYYTETRPYEHEEHLHKNAPHVSANPDKSNYLTKERMKE